MKVGIILSMVRATITVPADLHREIRDLAREGESFSAAICRLARAGAGNQPPAWIGMAEGGSDDSMRVEAILGEIIDGLEDLSGGIEGPDRGNA